MTNEEKAMILLEQLDKVLQIDFNFSRVYLSAIERGLEEIDKKENGK